MCLCSVKLLFTEVFVSPHAIVWLLLILGLTLNWYLMQELSDIYLAVGKRWSDSRIMAHNNVHLIKSRNAWEDKLAEGESQNKVVSEQF